MIDSDPEAIKVFSEMKACYADKGLVFLDDSPGFVEGVDYYAIRQEDIEKAVKAAECQEQLRSTERLAQRWAELQKLIIEKYAAELVDRRQKIDTALAKAKEYIAAHPEAFTKPQ